MRNLALMFFALIVTTAGSIVVFPIQLVRKSILKHSLSEYFKTIAIGLDQLGGSVLYNQEDWTVSSFTYFLCTYKQNKYACAFMKFIDLFFGNDHCRKSFENERNEFIKYVKDF